MDKAIDVKLAISHLIKLMQDTYLILNLLIKQEKFI